MKSRGCEILGKAVQKRKRMRMRDCKKDMERNEGNTEKTERGKEQEKRGGERRCEGKKLENGLVNGRESVDGHGGKGGGRLRKRK